MVMAILGIMSVNEQLRVTKPLVLPTKLANSPTKFREFSSKPDTLISQDSCRFT